MKRAVLAGLIAGGGILAASAYAVSADKADDKPRCEAGQMQQGEGWEARRAAHLAALKAKLKLTAGQEPAWNTFAEVSRPGPHPGIDRRAMRDDFEKLSTPERLDRMQAMAEVRRARMAERAAAIKAFYAQLTPEQQKVFDAEALPESRRGHHHRHQF
jgi:Spy/CpxP family protein refolding chaperone